MGCRLGDSVDTHIYAMPLPLLQPAERNTAAIACARLFVGGCALAMCVHARLKFLVLVFFINPVGASDIDPGRV